MSKLHIIFAINVDLFNKSGKFVERVSFPLPEDQDQYPVVAPNSTRHKLDLYEIGEVVNSELEFFCFPWIRRMFAMFRVTASGFDHVDCKYHLWIEDQEKGRIRSKKLAKAIYFADPTTGGKNRWMEEDRNLSDSKELEKLDLSKMELVPTIEKVLLVTEQTVDIDRLPVSDVC